MLFRSNDGEDLQRGLAVLVTCTEANIDRPLWIVGRCDLGGPEGPIVWPDAREALTTVHAVWNPDLEVPIIDSRMEALRKLYPMAGRQACGLLALLNSPKMARVEEADLTRLNKARVRKRKPPLLSHRVVTIDLGKVERTLREGDAAEGQGSPRQQHFVRWHLRLVRGVLYPVRPHWRGDPSLGTKPPAYRLTASPGPEDAG